jgi:hypothetical protein
MRVGLTRSRLLVAAILLLVSFTDAFTQDSSECVSTCHLSGVVVDNASHPLQGIPITIRRGAELLGGDPVTDVNGHYSISYQKGPTLSTVMYGDTKWGPALYHNLAGNRNNEINPILLSTEQAKYSADEAKDILAALDYFRKNKETYSREIIEYTGVFRAGTFPQDLRPRLDKFEEVAAAVRWDDMIRKLMQQRPEPTPTMAAVASLPLGLIDHIHSQKRLTTKQLFDRANVTLEENVADLQFEENGAELQKDMSRLQGGIARPR